MKQKLHINIGLTLIEVLVALFILSLCLAPLFTLMLMGRRSAWRAKNTLIAIYIARTILNYYKFIPSHKIKSGKGEWVKCTGKVLDLKEAFEWPSYYERFEYKVETKGVGGSELHPAFWQVIVRVRWQEESPDYNRKICLGGLIPYVE